MKLKQTHFELFRKECKKWIDKFELNDYYFNFLFEEDLDNAAWCDVNDIENRILNIGLSTTISDKQNSFDWMKKLAKHEIIHAILAKYRWLAYKRCIRREELDEVDEEIVRKLEKLL